MKSYNKWRVWEAMEKRTARKCLERLNFWKTLQVGETYSVHKKDTYNNQFTRDLELLHKYERLLVFRLHNNAKYCISQNEFLSDDVTIKEVQHANS
jgi:hypothetical protein